MDGSKQDLQIVNDYDDLVELSREDSNPSNNKLIFTSTGKFEDEMLRSRKNVPNKFNGPTQQDDEEQLDDEDDLNQRQSLGSEQDEEPNLKQAVNLKDYFSKDNSSNSTRFRSMRTRTTFRMSTSKLDSNNSTLHLTSVSMKRRGQNKLDMR